MGTGYWCLEYVANAAGAGENGPVAIWTVPEPVTRWYSCGCQLYRAVPSMRQLKNFSFPKFGTPRSTPLLEPHPRSIPINNDNQISNSD